MSERDAILSKLRNALAQPDLRFPPAESEPLTDATRMTVTSAEGDAQSLAHRFGQELTALYGSYEVVETPTEALDLAALRGGLDGAGTAAQKGAVIKTGQERSVLAWDPDSLPVGGLDDAFRDMGLTLAALSDLTGKESREAIRSIRYGVSGVEAAFAATGSLLVRTGAGMSRSASLLPYYHAALVPFSRLYPTAEDWLDEQRQAGALVDLLRTHANLTLITGPSKSADIEMILTLGVHGPKFLHVILFATSDVVR